MNIILYICDHWLVFVILAGFVFLSTFTFSLLTAAKDGDEMIERNDSHED